MTLPYERTRAVLNTRTFLYDLMDPKITPRVPREIRMNAARLLKHYPTSFDMVRAGAGTEAIFSEVAARGYANDR